MVFSIFTELCNLHHNFRTFLSPPQKESLYPLADPCIPHPSLPTQPQATTHYFSPYGFAYSGPTAFLSLFLPMKSPEQDVQGNPCWLGQESGWNFSVCFCPPRVPYWSWRPWSRRGAAARTLLQLQARPSLSDVGHGRLTCSRALGSAGCCFQLCQQPSGGRHCVSNRPLIKCTTLSWDDSAFSWCPGIPGLPLSAPWPTSPQSR